MKQLLPLLLLFAFVSAKSITPKVPSDLDSNKIAQFYFNQTVQLEKVDVPDLYFEIYRWLGKPYLLGGNSPSGIDCANFVKMLYQKVYQKDIDGNACSFFPQCIEHTDLDMAAEGDLVFFKINNSNITHVGIYLQHRKFAHVTVHSGVTISDIDDPYWSKYLFKAGRPQELLSAK